MSVDNGPLISLLLAAASMIVSYLAKNSSLVTRGINGQVEKAQQATTNGGNSISAVTIEAQNITSKLLITQMDDFKRETIRRLDDVILSLNEQRRHNDGRFQELDERIAGLTRRVHKLEHPEIENAN